MPFASIIVPIVLVIVGIWLLRKLIHVGFLLVVGALIVFGWWWFFIR